MHIPDGFVSGPINIVGGLVAATAIGVSAWRTSRELRGRPHVVPLLATTGAFIFAAQMLNFPIGGGTSGHLLGAAVVAALLGPWSACLVMSMVLVIQCLGFADGGITALGTNILNMGIIDGVGSYLVMRALRSVLPAGRGGYLAAVALASWIGIVAAAAAVGFELALSGTSPLDIALPAMVGAHVIIGIGEALITVAVVSAVIATRPDILPKWAGIGDTTAAGTGKKRIWTLAAVGLAVAFVLGIFVSPFASTAPEGLNRAVADKGVVASAKGKKVWKSAPLPHYAAPGAGRGGVSTSLAGFLGTAAMFAVGFGTIKLVSLRRKEQKN